MKCFVGSVGASGFLFSMFRVVSLRDWLSYFNLDIFLRLFSIFFFMDFKVA